MIVRDSLGQEIREGTELVYFGGGREDLVTVWKIDECGGVAVKVQVIFQGGWDDDGLELTGTGVGPGTYEVEHVAVVQTLQRRRRAKGKKVTIEFE